MGKKVGNLIKKARTDAGMTQEQLARKVKGVSAQDISNAERGNIDLTTQNLKDIAKATGVTQASLLNATSSKSTSRTTSRTSSRTTTSKTTSRTTASKSSMSVTATERKLVTYYREADASTKKRVMSILKGTGTEDLISDAVGNAIEGMIKSATKSLKK